MSVPAAVRSALDVAERHLRIGSRAELRGAVTRSHLPDFRSVGWYAAAPPGWSVAIDAEYADQAVPGPLARRFGTDDFWARWTRAECLCKLADVPMLAWWPVHGLDVPPDFRGAYRTLIVRDADRDVVVSVAFAPTVNAPSLGPHRTA